MTTRMSGTYANAAAGPLEIVFSAAFSSSTTHDAGFPGQPGDSDIVIECTVSQGGTLLGVTYIRSAVPSSFLILDYPGGSTSWSLVMDDISHTIVGLGGVSATDPQVACILIKR